MGVTERKKTVYETQTLSYNNEAEWNGHEHMSVGANYSWTGSERVMGMSMRNGGGVGHQQHNVGNQFMDLQCIH